MSGERKRLDETGKLDSVRIGKQSFPPVFDSGELAHLTNEHSQTLRQAANSDCCWRTDLNSYSKAPKWRIGRVSRSFAKANSLLVEAPIPRNKQFPPEFGTYSGFLR